MREIVKIMKFICNRNELNEALNNVVRAVPQKSTITALTGVKVLLDKESLELTGYDLEMGIQTKISVGSEDKGECVFEARLLCDIVRKMPSETITFEINDNLQTEIIGGKAHYKILAMSADEYPTLPSYDTGDDFTVSQPMLKNMINQTVFAVSVTDNKPILTGELFDISEGTFNLVAIDGFRLAVRTEKLNTENHYNFVVKARSLSEVSKLLKDDDKEKTIIHVSRKHIIFEINGYMVISRLLEGEFHNYKASIPKSHTTEIIIKTKELIESLERCMLLLNDKNKAPVRCIFDNGSVKITCSTGMGIFDEESDVDITGDKVEIGFNCRYMLEALRSTESDKIRMQLSGGIAPMKILPMQGDSFTFLVLPHRIRSDS